MIKVTLVSYTQWNPELALDTDNPEHITATGKRICQSGQKLKEIMRELEKIDARNIASLNPKNPKRAHMGVFEHISFTFLIEGASRVMSHQLVRHRIASYLQMSQRAVPMNKVELIVPSSIPEDMKEKFYSAMLNCYTVYKELKDAKVPIEDARFIMPHGMETRVWMTINARSLMHFFKERLTNPGAQWEIKEVARQMHELVIKVCPTIFDLKYVESWE